MAAVLVAEPSMAAGLEKRSMMQKREMLARELAWSSLPEHVQEDLAKRDPREYDLNWEMYLRDDDEESNGLVARQDGGQPGLGAKHCKDGQVAYTVDDGPYHWTGKIAQTFADAGHKISYFINVQNWDCAYSLTYVKQLRKAIRLGHDICSHSATHPHLNTLTLDQVKQQFKIVEQYTYKTLGLIPNCARPPYGETSPEINAWLRSQGYRVIQWSVDSGDADGDTAQQSVEIIKQQVSKNSGKIILGHETHQPTVDTVIPGMIKYFDSIGVKSVGMGQCLKRKPYKVKLNQFPALNPNLNCVNQNVPLPGKN
ncbi:glycoside hydrolase/deacetylase [Meira miltonrushii]|uniref:Glycoside hydrolase/deacetylase n=1 Tax=Meira miltonrushii TaxID=1280837 RepID=A0A316VKP9_9BASI|nr:glycoside hydrolase/deacetylase [Meira miltonrushii]PWN36631.1 glycoside hydrolase/deacetylase [Meira miltonrushii]